jgi:hypothetical protein
MIVTKYCGPTNFKGSRVSVKNAYTKKRMMVAWDHALNERENHTQAFRVFCQRYEIEFETFVALDNTSGFIFSINPQVHNA